ncbi:MAG: alpha-1,2-fucosyltransferase, partial [Prevotella sp.]|nr:alpha-1,2-fucosyltransferase [Prevotella sp.]
LQVWQQINNCNSVAIHVRRGDMLPMNYQYFADGYFKRATRYIKQHVVHPVFFIFCDQDTTEWGKLHIKQLGIDSKKDEFMFIDWNKDLDSWRDMQLMAACKHNIITRSSFGWWGSWLNTNPNKITISPIPSVNTTLSL